MALDLAILGFLDRGPMTGYDLKTRCFDDTVGHVWTADQAQVYRTLERLTGKGLVRSRLVPQRGRPDRRVYSITPRGRAALESWLRTPEEPAPVRDPLLLHLSLASPLPDDDLDTLLRAARESYQRRLESLRSDRARATDGDPRDDALRDMTLTAAMASARSAIDWIDDCLDRVASGLPAAGRPEREAAPCD